MMLLLSLIQSSVMLLITFLFAEAAQLSGLRVSIKKMESPSLAEPQEEYRSPSISINETEVKSVHQFNYLGCVISSEDRIDKEVDNRLAKANRTLVRLCRHVWNKQNQHFSSCSAYFTVASCWVLDHLPSEHMPP